MSIRSFALFFLFLGLPLLASAQTNANVYEVDFSQLLPYVLPFYAVTILGLGLFIHKLMRPNFSNKWLYGCCLVGILGAGFISYQFKDIRNKQLPAYQYEPSASVRTLSPELQAKIQERANSDLKETVSNYWVIAIPNFALLALGLIVDRQQQKMLQLEKR